MRIAETLEQQFPETAASEPGLIARHLTEAGLAEKAVAYRHRAGELAIRRSAMQEAIAELAAGLELLQSLPEDAGRDGRELELQIAPGNALNAAKGQSAPEAGWPSLRTCELCRKRGDPRSSSRPSSRTILVPLPARRASHRAGGRARTTAPSGGAGRRRRTGGRPSPQWRLIATPRTASHEPRPLEAGSRSTSPLATGARASFTPSTRA